MVSDTRGMKGVGRCRHVALDLDVTREIERMVHQEVKHVMEWVCFVGFLVAGLVVLGCWFGLLWFD